jgi:diguanylate cyclase (GGDEF)-like protein
MNQYAVIDPTGEYISFFFMVALITFSNFIHFTPSIKNIIFRILSYTAIISIVLGALNAHVLNNSHMYDDFFIRSVTHLFLVSVPILITLFAVFAFYYINENIYFIKKTHILYFSPTLLICFYIFIGFILNVKTGFYVVDNHIDYVFFALSVYYVILVALQLIKNSAITKAEYLVISFSYSALLLFAFIFYTIFPKILLSGSIATLAIMILLFFLQSKENSLDTVTNLPSRFSLKNTLKHYTAKNRAQSMDILLVSISNLTEINDKHGYTTGDIVLRSFSNFLSKEFGKHNTFRYTNTEFVLILKHKTARTYSKAINAINAKKEDGWIILGEKMTIECSYATMSYPSNVTSFEDIVTVLDHYTSKIENVLTKEVLHISPSVLLNIKRRNSIIRELREHVLNHHISIQYQPIYSLDSKKIVNIEALMRLNTDVLGKVSPYEFISIAEDTYLIVELGQILVEEVCILINSMEEMNIDFERVSINISSLQLFDDGFIENITRVMKDKNVSTSRIMLELTETIMISNFDKLNFLISKLKALGFSISLDDYGTGYSNYVKLAKLPFDEVKIDKSILHYISENDGEYSNLFSIIKSFKNKGLSIVMEGVETSSHFELSKSLEVDMVQGYYFSRPIDKHDLLKKLNE